MLEVSWGFERVKKNILEKSNKTAGRIISSNLGRKIPGDMKRLPSGSGVKNPPAMQEMQETWVQSLSQERAWQPTAVFLSGGSHGQKSLTHHSP